jgi:hypothetical protein
MLPRGLMSVWRRSKDEALRKYIAAFVSVQVRLLSVSSICPISHDAYQYNALLDLASVSFNTYGRTWVGPPPSDFTMQWNVEAAEVLVQALSLPGGLPEKKESGEGSSDTMMRKGEDGGGQSMMKGGTEMRNTRHGGRVRAGVVIGAVVGGVAVLSLLVGLMLLLYRRRRRRANGGAPDNGMTTTPNSDLAHALLTPYWIERIPLAPRLFLFPTGKRMTGVEEAGVEEEIPRLRTEARSAEKPRMVEGRAPSATPANGTGNNPAAPIVIASSNSNPISNSTASGPAMNPFVIRPSAPNPNPNVPSSTIANSRRPPSQPVPRSVRSRPSSIGLNTSRTSSQASRPPLSRSADNHHIPTEELARLLLQRLASLRVDGHSDLEIPPPSYEHNPRPEGPAQARDVR